MCSERGDAWAKTIRARLLSVNDLPPADAVYHQTCNVNFRTKKQIPRVYEGNQLPAVKKRKVVRPNDEERKVTKKMTTNRLQLLICRENGRIPERYR